LGAGDVHDGEQAAQAGYQHYWEFLPHIVVSFHFIIPFFSAQPAG
jgi:hypothetical protein